jgi:hypothetical protein
MKTRLWPAVAMAALALAWPAAAQDDTRYTDVVRAEVLKAAETLSSLTDAEPIDYFEGTLGPRGQERIDIPTYPGRTYAIVAGCDQDCSDIDLAVLDEDGVAVVEDEAEDDYPLVIFVAERGARYQVGVTMYDCAESICYYGAALFELQP